MRKISVVTSFGPNGYDQYAKYFLQTFREFWPKDVDLYVLHEGPEPEDLSEFKAEDLLQVPACKNFLQTFENDMEAQGRAVAPGRAWKSGAANRGYNFRFDAYKFGRKPFAIESAAVRAKSGLLFWMDADIQTRAPVSLEFLSRLIPETVGVTHIARPEYHSECGFIGYNLDIPGVFDFIFDMSHEFESGKFKRHFEWHDSYVFDRLLADTKFKKMIIPWRQKMTPVESSQLGQYFYHFKGNRKLSQQTMEQHKKAFK